LKTRAVTSQARTTAEMAAAFLTANDASARSLLALASSLGKGEALPKVR
jgi:hypothetical protein